MDLKSKINNCQRCITFGALKSTHTFIGERYDGTIVIGESPHKSWKEGNAPFMTPSGKRIVEYLGILGKTTDNVILLEYAKCVCPERKYLAKMMDNCEGFLTEEIKSYNPRLIISIGSAVCERMGKMWERKILPCNKYGFMDFPYISLFHPSPINPKNHKRNLDFLKSISGKNI